MITTKLITTLADLGEKMGVRMPPLHRLRLGLVPIDSIWARIDDRYYEVYVRDGRHLHYAEVERPPRHQRPCVLPSLDWLDRLICAAEASCAC